MACLAIGSAFAEAGKSGITDRQVSVVGFVDAGQLVRGSLVYGDGSEATTTPLEDLFLNRNGIALTYSGTLDERLRMNIGVGGLFYKPVASNPAHEPAEYKRISFGPGISEASAQYDFSRHLNVKFGFFGYKYNPDAVNLGEYLLRSEAYPGIIHTGSSGGWVWMNSNEYKSLGTKVSWTSLNGMLRHDFLMYSEFNDQPLFDFSPSYVATLKVMGAFEFGAGVSLHRWLPIQPSWTTPDDPQHSNTYVEVKNFPAYPALNSSLSHQSGFSGGTWKGMGSQITSYTYADGITHIATELHDASGGLLYEIVDSTGTPIDTLKASKTEKLTFKAIKLMGRASVDIASLLGMDGKSTGPFKAFVEVAVLGVQNQPYFYEKIQNRIPLMLGVDVPTFGILDLLCLQMEYFKNPYPDNSFQQFTNALPQPQLPGGNVAEYEDNLRAGVYDHDDLKWSLFVQKNLFTGLDLYAQVANDHLRVQNNLGEPSSMPLTQGKSDWYYMLRFQWSM
jgi:hypothetical protein